MTLEKTKFVNENYYIHLISMKYANNICTIAFSVPDYNLRHGYYKCIKNHMLHYLRIREL